LRELYGQTYSTHGGDEKFSSENLKRRTHLKDTETVGQIIIKMDLTNFGGRARTGIVWLRIVSSGGM
jgi:hypothetical protein